MRRRIALWIMRSAFRLCLRVLEERGTAGLLRMSMTMWSWFGGAVE